MSTPTPTDVKSSQPISLGFLEERYSDISLLGQGGMGQVFKAFDKTLLKWVAIKLLSGKGNNQELVVRFQNEARAASKLKHPNIVTVMDFGKSPEDDLYLVMELVEGASLSEYLEKKGRLEIFEALKIVISISDGLAHAHSQGIVHRDLKPSNIVISSSGSPKIVDFGIAKLPMEDDDQELTKTGVIMGSPLYMSPEQATGDFVDHRSDLYSVGCILYRMLTGVPPFKRDNPVETMYAHMGDTPAKMSEAGGIDFPQELENVVANLLSKNKNDRFSSASDLKYQLIELELALDDASNDLDDDDSPTEDERIDEATKSASFILNDDDLLVDPDSSKGMTKGQIAILGIFVSIACVAIVMGAQFMLDKYLTAPAEIELKPARYKHDSDVLNEPMYSDTACTISNYSEAQLKSFRKQFKRGDIRSFLFINCRDMGDGLKYFTDLRLNMVVVRNCDITDSGLKFLRDMKYLDYVVLDGNKNITASGLNNLLNVPQLRKVAFMNMDATILDREFLKKLNQIESLNLTGTINITEKKWDVIARWPRLRYLRLGEFQDKDFDYSQLKKLPKLRKLTLRPVLGLTPEKRKKLLKYFYPIRIEFDHPYQDKIDLLKKK